MFRNLNLRDEFKAQSEAPANRSEYPNHDEIAHELGAEQVSYEIIDTTRWGHVVEYIYRRRDQYVSVTYTEGSGDSEYEYEPEFHEVIPVEKTITAYEVKN